MFAPRRSRVPLLLLLLLALPLVAGAQGPVAVQPQLNVLDFPLAGTIHQAPQLSGYTVDATGSGGASSVAAISIAPGHAGVLRECTLVVDGGSGDAWNQGLVLDIYYDGHASADVSVPWACLFALETASTASAGVDSTGWDAGLFAMPEPPFKSGNYGTHRDHASYVLRYPIPYTNGIVVKFRATTSAFSIWCNWQYQDQLPACWNRTYRFFAVRSTSSLATVGGVPIGEVTIDAHGNLLPGTGFLGTFSSANIGRYVYGTWYRTRGTRKVNLWEAEILARPSTTTLTLDSLHLGDIDPQTSAPYLDPTADSTFGISPAHTFLDRPAGRDGYVITVSQGWTGASVFNYLEGNTRFKTPGAVHPFYEATGTEDFYGHAFYFEKRAQGLTCGVPCYDLATHSVSAYRIFRPGLRYTNGIKGIWPALVTPVTSKVTVVYYERVP